MTEKHKSIGADLFFTLIVVGRVVLMIGIWLILFLMLFLGYFTVPILLIAGLTLVYVLTDFVMVSFVNKQRKSMEQRQEIIDQNSKDEEQ